MSSNKYSIGLSNGGGGGGGGGEGGAGTVHYGVSGKNP
mgnify:CR=1 FL=1